MEAQLRQQPVGKELRDIVDINITELIDTSKISRYQFSVITLCGFIGILDGFDLQSIAFVAPVIAAEWHVPISNFTTIFAAGLIGLALGSFVFGLMADIFGRRRVILVSMIIFSAFSIVSGVSTSVPTLGLCRFLTGFGLGGALPNLIALTAEYAPAHRRASVITIMYMGVPFGAVLGGAVSAAWVIPQLGWAWVFFIGGALPLVLLPFVIAALPESIRFLLSKGMKDSSIARIVSRINPSALPAETSKQRANFTVTENQLPGLPVRHLFSGGRVTGTIPLWIAFFMNLLVLYILVSWLPSLLRQSGLPVERAIIASVVLNIGGMVGGLLQSRLIDMFGSFKVLSLAYVAGAAIVASLGFLGSSVPLLMALVFASGFFVMGAQFGANALAADFYPTSVRSTGTGWALGVGRIGSIVGPVIAGILLSYQLTNRAIFLVTALPAVIAAAAILVMSINLRTREARFRFGAELSR